MSATVRVHRGNYSADRYLVMGSKKLGQLTDEITEFTVPPGEHLFSLTLGFYHSVGSWVTLHDGDVVDLVAEDNREAVVPVLQGGFLRLVRSDD